MLAVTRKNKIKDILTERKSITVSELAITFEVTEETIRRDLKALEDEGFLTRAYGGAFIQSGVENNVDISIRQVAYTDSKHAIAKACKKIIHNGDSIFLDPSTTAFFIAKEISDMKLTVVTNSMLVVNQLSSCPNIRLVNIGGTFSKDHKAFLGSIANNQMNNLFVDKSFISARSVSIENGITDSAEELSTLRKIVINRSNESYFVADYSKFNKTSFIQVCELEKLTGIVTDRVLDSNWQDYLDTIHTAYISC